MLLELKNRYRNDFHLLQWWNANRTHFGPQRHSCLAPVCMCVCSISLSDSLWPHGQQPARLLCPWNFPGKNSGVGCHLLLQTIFQAQGWNLCLLHWQLDSLPLAASGKPQLPCLWQLYFKLNIDTLFRNLILFYIMTICI